MSAALSSVAILVRNASSTCRASAAVRLFLAPRIRWAQFAASSAEVICANSVNNCRHRAADASAARIGLADGDAEARRWNGPCWVEYRRPPFSRSLPANRLAAAYCHHIILCEFCGLFAKRCCSHAGVAA